MQQYRERGNGTTGKYVVKKTATGIKFDLKAGNGEIIATGEGYRSKSGCMNGIESIRKNAGSEITEEE